MLLELVPLAFHILGHLLIIVLDFRVDSPGLPRPDQRFLDLVDAELPDFSGHPGPAVKVALPRRDPLDGVLEVLTEVKSALELIEPVIPLEVVVQGEEL